MAWIRTLEAEEAKGSLKDLYEQVKSPSGHNARIHRWV